MAISSDIASTTRPAIMNGGASPAMMAVVVARGVARTRVLKRASAGTALALARGKAA